MSQFQGNSKKMAFAIDNVFVQFGFDSAESSLGKWFDDFKEFDHRMEHLNDQCKEIDGRC